MIQLLSEIDRAVTLAFLNRAPETNLYMIGNLESLGFGSGQNNDICQFWGDFDQRNNSGLQAILNRYMNGWSVYGDATADWQGLAQVMDQFPTSAARFQDNPGGVDSFLPYLDTYQPAAIKVEELMKLSAADFRPSPPPMGAIIRRATKADLPALITFYADAEHMSRSQLAVERPLLDTRIWVAIWQREIRSAALTNAEADNRAMIGGVYTRPAARGYGLSKAVCSALCAELLSQRKQPILYWDSPAAGQVYRRLGFKRLGEWRSVMLQRVPELAAAFQERLGLIQQHV